MIRSGLAIVACALFWTVLVHFRPFLISAHCMGNGAPLCDPSRIPFFDRWAWGLQYGWADGLSFWTQYSAGALAVVVVLLVPHSRKLVTFIYFVLCTIANGALTEMIRVIVQRPRPFVFGALEHAESLAHYTSFVSGHTSYTASMAMGISLLLARNRQPLVWIKNPVPIMALSWLICVSTATLRVFAGRHFVSDTVGGICSGSLAAGFAYLLFKRSTATINRPEL